MQVLLKLFLLTCTCVYIFILYGVFFQISLVEKLTAQSKGFGDLYEMSKVLLFKKPIDGFIQPFPTSTIEEADVILMGDSFMNSSIGYPIIPDQIATLSGLKIHNYNMQGGGETWRKTNPIDYLESIGATFSAKPRILVLESVDRGLFMRYGHPLSKDTNSTTTTTTTDKIATSSSSGKFPEIHIDEIISQDGRILVKGWAVDNEDGSPLQSVAVLMGGSSTAVSYSRVPRPDVANAFSRGDWNLSGFSISLPNDKSLGLHTIEITATDSFNQQTKVKKSLLIVPQFSSFNLLKEINSYIKQKLLSIEYVTANNPISFLATELIATTNFITVKKISPLTPRYTLNPNILYYRDEVSFVENQPASENIDKIVATLKHIQRELQEEYNITLIVMPMPNKYTLFHDRVSPTIHSSFLDDLAREINSVGIQYIDLQTSLRVSPSFPFEFTDTHLSKEGASLVTKRIVDSFKQVDISASSSGIRRDSHTQQ